MDESLFIDLLTQKMMIFDREAPQRIHHFLKVHRFAQLIARLEGLDDHTRFLTECAALVHDIGIRPAEEKYGRCDGKLQEKEGPAYARALLKEMGMDGPDLERICYLVGHHHTCQQIDGLDYQILVEADFLVNFYDDSLSREAVGHAVETIFRTKTGKKLCQVIYGCPKADESSAFLIATEE